MAPAPAADTAAATVASAGETAPTAQDGANGVAIWLAPRRTRAQSLVLGAAGTGGLEVFGLDGALQQRRFRQRGLDYVDVLYGFDDRRAASRPLVRRA